MNWPQHRTPPEAHRSTATYNFVALPERVYYPPGQPFAAHDRLDSARLHGWIDLEITTETHLYTRCAYPPDVDPEGNSADRDALAKQEFYHHGVPAQPWIPGSSLRGAARALVEILGFARLDRRGRPGEVRRMRDEQLVHRAVADQDTPVGKGYSRRFLDIDGSRIEFPSASVRAGYLYCLAGEA